MSPDGCRVEGCTYSGRLRKGYCDTHYRRFLRHGDPTKGRSIKGEGLGFLINHIDHGEKECLIWPYGRTSAGYGTTTIAGRLEYVHRAMCSIVHGEPSHPDQQARHTCGNGHLGCFNPNHLEWGTRSENQMDRVDHDTSNRGVRHPMNKLTQEEVLEIYAIQNPDFHSIAAQYGVNHMTVRDIIAGRTWAWLTGMN